MYLLKKGEVEMRQAKKKKSAVLRRSMALFLSLVMISSYFGLHFNHPTVVKADTTAIIEDFESEDRIGFPMGGVTLERSSNSMDGTNALYVSNRTQDWNSYSYDIKQFNGKSIQFNAQMRADAENLVGFVCVKTKVSDKEAYTWIYNNALVNGQYTQINTYYSIPQDSTETILYFGTWDYVANKATCDSFYLDNISIKESMFIKENFDDYTDTESKKGSVFGSPTLTLIPNGDKNKALEVSNRSENYYGYAYNLNAFAGNKITVKARISAVGAAADVSNTFNATLKTTKTGTDDAYKQVATVTTTGSNYVVMQSAEYELLSGSDSYSLYFEGPKDVTYAIDDIEIVVVGDYTNPSSGSSYVDYTSYPILKDLYKDYFKMGVACEAISHWSTPNQLSEIGNPVKEDFMSRQFSSITFGNELKPDSNMGYKDPSATETNLPFIIHPAAKEMLDWAKSVHMPVRGHTLVWHSQCPEAIFCKEYQPVKTDNKLSADCLVSREVLLQRLKSYIDSTMKYMYENNYADVIYAWDVVNEAVEPGANQYNLRNSYWYQIIGDDFVYYAFKFTREAVDKYSVEFASKYGVDPSNAEQLDTIQPSLFYNDYNEFQAVKCDAIISMITRDVEGPGKSMVSQGYIDGIGMQGHLSDNTSIPTYIEALRKYDQVVDEVQITELDVSQTTTGVNAEYYQAKFYKEFFEALIAEVKNGVNLNSVTVWGLTDDNSWKKETLPLLFKGNLSKKLAFDGLVAAVNGTELPEPAFVAPDFKDMNATFDAEDATVESEGFSVRGGGLLSIQSDVVFNGKNALLDTGRTANWHGASFDVSRFIGQTIEVSAWVKCAAPEVKLSADIDGVWPNLAAVDTSDGEWKQLTAVYQVPSNMTALKLYFEAGTLDDIYIDSVKVKLHGMNEDFEGEANIASARGVAHVPSFAGVTDTDSYNESGHSFLVKRAEQDATMKFDVSKYIGYNITVKAFVKTSDAKIRLGFDSDTPVLITEVDSVAGEWTEINATYKLSNQLTAASLYIETDGNADIYIDNISVLMSDLKEDVEGATTVLTTRWGGAGTLSIVEDGAKDNHVAVLKDRTANYMGIAFDVTSYIGMDVLVSMDVKTNDAKISLTGDIDGTWPNYVNTTSNKGQYKTIHAAIKLPSNLSTLRLYVETDGTSDLYVDNVTIKRIPVGTEHKLIFDMNGHGIAPVTQLVTEGGYAYQVSPASVDNYSFDGWYKDAACTTPWDFASDTITTETTLYAKWTESSTPTPTPEVPTPTPSTPVVTTPTVESKPIYSETKEYDKVVYDVTIKNPTAMYSIIKKALAGGKDIIFEFTSNSKLLYSYTLKAGMYDPSVILGNMKLGLTIGSAKDLNQDKGILLSMEQTGKLAMETVLKVNVSDYFKAGDTVYLYKYNKETKKLECQPNNKYVVGSDAFVSLNIITGGDYVLLPAAASRNEKKGFLSQVELKKKLELSAGQVNQQFISFPDFFAFVSDLTDFDASKHLASIGTTVTFKTNNNKVVYVDENGNLWAIRKGTCKVAAIVTTSTGKTIKYVTTITVK